MAVDEHGAPWHWSSAVQDGAPLRHTPLVVKEAGGEHASMTLPRKVGADDDKVGEHIGERRPRVRLVGGERLGDERCEGVLARRGDDEIEEGWGRIAVVGETGKLLGLITRTDVLRQHNLYSALSRRTK